MTPAGLLIARLLGFVAEQPGGKLRPVASRRVHFDVASLLAGGRPALGSGIADPLAPLVCAFRPEQAFTTWPAGGGIKPGIALGTTDDLGFQVAENPVHVQATILHLLGLGHARLTDKSQGRDFRLTDVGGVVIDEILA